MLGLASFAFWLCLMLFFLIAWPMAWFFYYAYHAIHALRCGLLEWSPDEHYDRASQPHEFAVHVAWTALMAMTWLSSIIFILVRPRLWVAGITTLVFVIFSVVLTVRAERRSRARKTDFVG